MKRDSTMDTATSAYTGDTRQMIASRQCGQWDTWQSRALKRDKDSKEREKVREKARTKDKTRCANVGDKGRRDSKA